MKNSYDIDSIFYDDVNFNQEEDISFLKQIIPSSANTILDLGCGSGRLTFQLVQKNRSLYGIDLSKKMISLGEKTNKKLPNSCKVNFFNLNMANFRLKTNFDFIFCGYNSIQHLTSNIKVINFFNSVYNHLNKTGLFFLDLMNPNFDFLPERVHSVFKKKFFSSEYKDYIYLFEKRQYDRATQINSIKYIYSQDNEMKNVICTSKFKMRQFFPQEIDYLLFVNNFRIINKWGDYDFSNFNKNSDKQLILCSKKNGKTK